MRHPNRIELPERSYGGGTMTLANIVEVAVLAAIVVVAIRSFMKRG
jgi:hypothetical protein